MEGYKLGEHLISKMSPTFIIAELSANHNQDLDLAIKTIEAMKESGADAVKIQTYTPDTITIDCKSDLFKVSGEEHWKDKYLYELYGEAQTPWEWHSKLKEVTESLGMVFFSSPFDPTSVDFLEELGVPAYKIASYEITDIPLIEYVARKNKPILISTGIATIEDIQLAMDTCYSVGNEQIILLKCTSGYPTPLEEVNLNSIKYLSDKFKLIVGLSDHTMTTSVPVSAVTLGAKVIEKHFILDRKMGGVDSFFSLNPEEFKNMVDRVREVEKSLGSFEYTVSEKMRAGRAFSKSLFAVKDIKKGETLTEENVRPIRPGYGLHPKYHRSLMGKVALTDIRFGEPLKLEHFSK